MAKSALFLTDKEKLEQKLYIVYKVMLNGDKVLYTKNYGNDFVFTLKQLKSVVAHIKKHSVRYEIHEIKLQELGVVEI